MSVDHLALMRAAIIDQFKGLPNLDAFVHALGDQLNDVEEFYGQLQAGMKLTASSTQGAQLDHLGVLLNQPREGLSDTDYIDVLLSRCIALQGDATAEDMINIMSMIGRPARQSLVEMGNARMQMVGVAPDPVVSLGDLKATLLAAKSAGVGLGLYQSPIPVFRYGVTGDPNSAGYGVGHYATPI